jgi:hypothetical protein
VTLLIHYKSIFLYRNYSKREKTRETNPKGYLKKRLHISKLVGKLRKVLRKATLGKRKRQNLHQRKPKRLGDQTQA